MIPKIFREGRTVEGRRKTARNLADRIRKISGDNLRLQGSITPNTIHHHHHHHHHPIVSVFATGAQESRVDFLLDNSAYVGRLFN
ncbi:unnamed protein product [Lactuca saligna]|uniref:Uncharacterized protein n=1 Tax=Lactuca saligna TaxID=75948 RepID=A0AA36DY00_LACSI|nr:unnamed protein product [Lactuca saligna]